MNRDSEEIAETLSVSLPKENLLRQVEHWWKRAISSKVARQTGILYLSNILAMLSGLLTAPIVTRALGPERYGDLAFVSSFILFSHLFFDLGLFDSGAKLLANTEEENHQQQLLGAFLVASIVMAMVFSVFTFSAGFWVDLVFNTTINSVLWTISSFVGVFLVRMIIEQICKGLNRINLLFTLRVLPVIWYLIWALVLVRLSAISVQGLLMANMSGMWLATLWVAFRLKPSFTEAKKSLTEVIEDIKSYGFKVFTGRALNTAARQSDRLIIGLFGSTTSVGFYSLAQMMVQPILLLPQSLASSSYRKLASEPRIPREMIIANVVWLTCSSAGLLILGKTIVEILLSRTFEGVTPLMLLSIIGSVLAGLTRPFNAFLGAKGQGEYLRKMALTFTVYDIAANFVLIYLFGSMGAVYSFIGERALSLGVHLHFYRKCVAGSKKNMTCETLKINGR